MNQDAAFAATTSPITEAELADMNRAGSLLDIILDAEGAGVNRALTHLSMTLGVVNYNGKVLLEELAKFRENQRDFTATTFKRNEYNTYLQRIYTLIYNHVSSIKTLVDVMYIMKDSAKMGDVNRVAEIGDAFKFDIKTKAFVEVRNMIVHGRHLPVSCRWSYFAGQGMQRVVMSFTKEQSKRLHASLLEEWYPGKWSMDLDELVSKHLNMTNKLAGKMRTHVKRKKRKELKEVREARKEHAVVMKRLRELYKTQKPT